jgi:hypothetical protein
MLPTPEARVSLKLKESPGVADEEIGRDRPVLFQIPCAVLATPLS